MQAFRIRARNDRHHEEFAGTGPVGARSDPRHSWPPYDFSERDHVSWGGAARALRTGARLLRCHLPKGGLEILNPRQPPLGARRPRAFFGHPDCTRLHGLWTRTCGRRRGKGTCPSLAVDASLGGPGWVFQVDL